MEPNQRQGNRRTSTKKMTKQNKKTIREYEKLFKSRLAERETEERSGQSLLCYKKYVLFMSHVYMQVGFKSKPIDWTTEFVFYPTCVAMKCEHPAHEHDCRSTVSPTDADTLWLTPFMWEQMIWSCERQSELFKETVYELEETKRRSEVWSVKDNLFYTLRPISGGEEGKIWRHDFLKTYADLNRTCELRKLEMADCLRFRALKGEDGSLSDWLFVDAVGRHYISWVHPTTRKWKIFHEIMRTISSKTSQ